MTNIIVAFPKQENARNIKKISDKTEVKDTIILSKTLIFESNEVFPDLAPEDSQKL